MNLRRFLGLFAALAIALVVTAAPAFATPAYPPSPPGHSSHGVQGVPVQRVSGGLARTGSNLLPIVGTGLVLVMVGGLLLVVRRRRIGTHATG